MADHCRICRGGQGQLDTENSISDLVEANQILIVITLFPIDLAPNGTPLGAESIGNSVITIQIRFDLTRFFLELLVGS